MAEHADAIDLGALLEYTEGIGHVCCVIFGSGMIGAAMHGVSKPTVRVRGASGCMMRVIYFRTAGRRRSCALQWARR